MAHRPNSRLLFIFIASICVALALLVATAPVQATPAAESPGALYVFGADSRLTNTLPAWQQLAAISGNNVVWQDNRANDLGYNADRIFYKDVSSPDSTEQALTPGRNRQSNPAVSGNLVAWDENVRPPTGGTGTQVFYMYLGGPGPFLLSDSSYRQFRPRVSGSRIVYCDQRHGSANPDIYLVDLDTGAEQPISTESGEQIKPDIDGDWVVFVDNRDIVLGKPRVNDIFAKNVVTGALRRLTSDSGSVLQDSPRISGSRVVWHEWNSNSIMLYDLDSGEKWQIATSSGASLDIEGDIVVWAQDGEVHLYDIATGISQQVSENGDAEVYHPAVSAGHIVWTDDREGTRGIYQNQLGMRAQELAERYAPYLYLHHEEYFQPRKVDIFLAGEGARLMQRNGGDSFSMRGWPELTLSSLGQFIGSNDQPGNLYEGKYIDLPGNVSNAWLIGRFSEWLLRRDFIDRYNVLANNPDYPELYYARIVKSANGARATVQYWIPYYFNNFSNFHEGDWEMVQVDLDGDLQPKGAAFSQHTGGMKRSWDYVKHSDTHPISCVGRGSHANYFEAGVYNVQVENIPDQTDYAEAQEPIHKPLIEVLPDVTITNLGSLADGPFGWLAYQGAWGEILGIEGFDGPQGPAATPEHNAAWDDPFSWYDGLLNDGAPLYSGEPYSYTYGSVASPAEIHLYDAAGNHVGKNASDGIDKQIAGAEYLEIPELHRKTIIVHGGDASSGFRFVLEGTGQGTFDFTVGSPDRANNSSDAVDYVDVPVTASTRVELNLNQDPNYSLQIDSEGDGVVDCQRQPDSVIHNDIDLNPPSKVNDLTVTQKTSGTATLAFTAPGDDGNAGAAQYYDVRYSESPVTEDNWKIAKPVESIPLPQPAGSAETVTVTGLAAGTTYYFALKAKDEVLQTSALSNVTQSSSEIPGLTWSRLRVYWASWADYQTRHLSIDYRMSNTGTGRAIDPTIQASVCTLASVYVVTPLPVAVGNLSPGANAGITLKYHVPLTIFSFTTTTYANCKDDAGRMCWFPEHLSL